MPDYTSGYYIYFNNMTDKPEIRYIDFILDHIHYMYITSLLNIPEETFVSFPKKLFKKNLNNG